MGKRRPRRYSEEFRAEAVRLARESGRPQKAIAAELGDFRARVVGLVPSAPPPMKSSRLRVECFRSRRR